jgi:hypothetical protein
MQTRTWYSDVKIYIRLLRHLQEDRDTAHLWFKKVYLNNKLRENIR